MKRMFAVIALSLLSSGAYASSVYCTATEDPPVMLVTNVFSMDVPMTFDSATDPTAKWQRYLMNVPGLKLLNTNHLCHIYNTPDEAFSARGNTIHFWQTGGSPGLVQESDWVGNTP